MTDSQRQQTPWRRRERAAPRRRSPVTDTWLDLPILTDIIDESEQEHRFSRRTPSSGGEKHSR